MAWGLTEMLLCSPAVAPAKTAEPAGSLAEADTEADDGMVTDTADEKTLDLRLSMSITRC